MLGFTVVVVVHQQRLLDDDPRRGLLYSATALGSFVIRLIISRIHKSMSIGWVTICALTVGWVLQLAWAMTTSITVGVIVLVLFQAASTPTIMNGIIVRQSLAHDHLRSPGEYDSKDDRLRPAECS